MHIPEDELEFSVASVWREERVSCPHPDILQAYQSGSLPTGAMQFLDLHLQESQCPYCSATLQDLQSQQHVAAASPLSDLRDRLLRSTRAELDKNI